MLPNNAPHRLSQLMLTNNALFHNASENSMFQNSLMIDNLHMFIQQQKVRQSREKPLETTCHKKTNK